MDPLASSTGSGWLATSILPSTSAAAGDGAVVGGAVPDGDTLPLGEPEGPFAAPLHAVPPSAKASRMGTSRALTPSDTERRSAPYASSHSRPLTGGSPCEDAPVCLLLEGVSLESRKRFGPAAAFMCRP